MSELAFTLCGLEELAAREDRLLPESRIHHARSIGSATVKLAPMPIGAAFLERWPVREGPGPIDWRAAQYESLSPALFVLHNALVHSSAGIVAIDGHVVRDTLNHTEPHRQHFRLTDTGICLTPGRTRYLAGTHISVLCGATANYFHAIMEGVMRLAMLHPPMLDAAESVLHAAGSAAQCDMLRLFGFGPARLTAVADDETLLVEKLVLPLSIHGLSSYHPCVLAMCERIAAGLKVETEPRPRRLYLDRRGSSQRRLANEEQIVATLQQQGFVAVQLEHLPLADQIRLFGGAGFIVAPHGAGLTNLGFCTPGCNVLELQMDAYVNWTFRHLAAVRGLRYDCVLGRCIDPWGDDSAAVHDLRWQISADHVAAAVAHMLAQ